MNPKTSPLERRLGFVVAWLGRATGGTRARAGSAIVVAISTFAALVAQMGTQYRHVHSRAHPKQIETTNKYQLFNTSLRRDGEIPVLSPKSFTAYPHANISTIRTAEKNTQARTSRE